MKRPGSLDQASARGYLLACISCMGLGVVLGSFVAGTVSSSVATVLVVLGSIFGLAYLSRVRR